MTRVGVIGAGFSGLSAACFLAKAGFKVDVFEKNASAGGRARQFQHNGFTFDMGPSWYWMPDVFDRFFSQFGKQAIDYYKLVRLDPSYQIIYSPSEKLDVPAGLHAVVDLFESIEPGSGIALSSYLKDAAVKYNIAMNEFVFKPGLSVFEFMSLDVLKNALHLQLFRSVSSSIKRYFHSPRLIQLLEFPMLFLGAKPDQTPALYSLMNYADIVLGTWYPMGGMFEVVKAMQSLALSLGVTFHFDSPVEHIETHASLVTGLITKSNRIALDYLVASGDYHHVEQQLLPPDARQYSETYWNSRIMAPSAIIFYIGLTRKIPGLKHHNLFFDTNFTQHAREIYDEPKWPTAPQFYVSCPSKTDATVAPSDGENLFVLIPTATGLEDSKETRDYYLEEIIIRIEKLTGQNIRNDVSVCRTYAHNDFIGDYNAFKGNAYGLANTLWQTAYLKPSIVNNKIRNLFYTGQLTVPGPGVPPSIISGQVTAAQLIKTHHELVN